VSRLDRARQRDLYRKAQGRPLDLSHFVGDAGPRLEVIHDGLNTLPAPPPLRRFSKRFCRPDGDLAPGGGDRLFGYNEGPTRRLIGPGYFVAVPTGATWSDRGDVVIDYFQIPDGPVAEGWPRIVPNDHGLQRFVYRGTRDFMRGVSAHVSIGAVVKGDEPMDHYFVLCRRPA
jgi:hypothetical protein